MADNEGSSDDGGFETEPPSTAIDGDVDNEFDPWIGPDSSTRNREPIAPLVDGVPCRICGTLDAETRRFCTRCGEALPTTSGPVEDESAGGDPFPAEEVTAETPVVVAAPSKDDVRRCEGCGTANGPERRFCEHCGSPLPTLGATQSATDASQRPSWWRRLRGDPALRGKKRRFRRSLVVQHRALRILAALLVVVVALAFLGVGGADPIGWAKQRWHDFRGTSYIEIDGLEADAASTEDPSFPADDAVDDRVTGAWATAWAGAPEPEPAKSDVCEVPPQPGALQLVLTEPSPVDRVSLGAGLPEDDPERLKQWLPTAAQITTSTGDCRRVLLEDGADLQHFSVDGAEISTLNIAIVAAAPAVEGAEPALVAIHSVKIWRKR